MRDSYGRAVMTFGKFKGETLTEIPDAYLRWCLAEIETMADDLRFAIQAEVRRRTLYEHGSQNGSSHSWRDQDRPDAGANLPVAVDRLIAAEIIKEGRRVLASKFHPDRGGDAERMVKINATADHLQNRLAQVLGGHQ